MKNQRELKKYFEEVLMHHEDVLNDIETFLKTVPKGSITVEAADKNGKYRYKHYVSGEFYRRIPSDKEGFIRLMVKKEYYLRLKPILISEIRAIRSGKFNFDDKAKFDAYDCMHPGKKAFIEPIFESPVYKIQKWESAEYETNTSYPEELIYETEKCEKRRSKSERDISNELDRHSDILAYIYEPKIYLENSKKWFCPDFMIINLETGRVYYWEHFGGFGFEKYSGDFVNKMQEFGKEPIEFRESLVFTYEDDKHPLQPSMYKDIINRIILSESCIR